MYRAIYISSTQALKCFPKRTYLNNATPEVFHWEAKKTHSLSWSRTPSRERVVPETSQPAHPVQVRLRWPSSTIASTPTPTLTPNSKLYIESYDEWFERRLKDKPKDMFLL